MEKLNEKDKEYRFGTWGAKYLINGPFWEGGFVLFYPGQTLGKHYHNEVEETFIFLEGTPKIIINDIEYRVSPGDVFRISPTESHDIINDTDKPTKALFIKCPYKPTDKVSL